MSNTLNQVNQDSTILDQDTISLEKYIINDKDMTVKTDDQGKDILQFHDAIQQKSYSIPYQNGDDDSNISKHNHYIKYKNQEGNEYIILLSKLYITYINNNYCIDITLPNKNIEIKALIDFKIENSLILNQELQKEDFINVIFSDIEKNKITIEENLFHSSIQSQIQSDITIQDVSVILSIRDLIGMSFKIINNNTLEITPAQNLKSVRNILYSGNKTLIYDQAYADLNCVCTEKQNIMYRISLSCGDNSQLLLPLQANFPLLNSTNPNNIFYKSIIITDINNKFFSIREIFKSLSDDCPNQSVKMVLSFPSDEILEDGIPFELKQQDSYISIAKLHESNKYIEIPTNVIDASATLTICTIHKKGYIELNLRDLFITNNLENTPHFLSKLPLPEGYEQSI